MLALCLHCLMVKAGFRTAEDKSSRPRFSRLGGLFGRKSSYTPPPSWLCLLPSTEFLFRWGIKVRWIMVNPKGASRGLWDLLLG